MVQSPFLKNKIHSPCCFKVVDDIAIVACLKIRRNLHTKNIAEFCGTVLSFANIFFIILYNEIYLAYLIKICLWPKTNVSNANCRVYLSLCGPALPADGISSGLSSRETFRSSPSASFPARLVPAAPWWSKGSFLRRLEDRQPAALQPISPLTTR